MPEQKPGLAASLRPYVTGGSAACFASFCIHPIDVTKVRLQVVPPPATAVSVASGIMKAEGVSGLYAGLSSAILRQATYGTAVSSISLRPSKYDRLVTSPANTTSCKLPLLTCGRMALAIDQS